MKKRLRISWSKKEKDLVINYPDAPDGHLMHIVMHHTPIAGCDGRSLREELERRGYDITTLKFTIQRFDKPEHRCNECGEPATFMKEGDNGPFAEDDTGPHEEDSYWCDKHQR